MRPFVLSPIFKERIWGSDALPAPYPQPEPGKPIGEVWLTAEECILSGGAQAGKSLAEAVQAEAAPLKAEHGFPLLLKLLLPREKLSVQVHPNDAEAQAMGQPRGKTECWYVLQADPGAQVAVGLREPLAPEAIAQAISDGSLEQHMRMLPVKAGDMVFVDAGTIHAIGPGMLVLETQQYSDVTYRLFDYGRPRELHVDQGLAVTKMSTHAGLIAPVEMDGFTRLLSSEYFIVDRFDLHAGQTCALGNDTALQILFTLDEGCSVSDSIELALPPGQAVVLPAEGSVYNVHASKQATVMRILHP
jgi:mannose-6-phosphate isomerase